MLFYFISIKFEYNILRVEWLCPIVVSTNSNADDR